MPRTHATAASVDFFEKDGRLPGFAQRRLGALAAKKKTRRGLTPSEEAELTEMLNFIDRKNLEMLRKLQRVRSVKS